MLGFGVLIPLYAASECLESYLCEQRALRRPPRSLTEQPPTFILNVIPLVYGTALRAKRGTNPSHSKVVLGRATLEGGRRWELVVFACSRNFGDSGIEGRGDEDGSVQLMRPQNYSVRIRRFGTFPCTSRCGNA
jgi:hypothetical protein